MADPLTRPAYKQALRYRAGRVSQAPFKDLELAVDMNHRAVCERFTWEAFGAVAQWELTPLPG